VHQITVSGVEVSVLRKAIRHLRLGVYPPYGTVRLAAPIGASDEEIELLIANRLPWIKRQQARFEGRPRPTSQEMVSGECHYFLGQPYVLHVIERQGSARVSIHGTDAIELSVRPSSSLADRARALEHWYREQLKELVPPLLAAWQPRMRVEAAQWGIRKMRTRWGSCNIRARRIWLSLELARKPAVCLEYVVVHELVHLLERRHNQRFVAYMDQFLPTWRLARAELNRLPGGTAAIG
jgi:predicted metal-dependent hydrolase